MTRWPLLTQAIRYQKTAVDNAFSLCSAMQLNGQDMLENSLQQYPWLPENEKRGYLTWASECIQATDVLKYMIDRGFLEVEKHLSESVSAAQDAAKKKVPPSPKKPAAEEQISVKNETAAETRESSAALPK